MPGHAGTSRPVLTMELAMVPTRLKWRAAVIQDRLMNWSYAAMRAHLNPAPAIPDGSP